MRNNNILRPIWASALLALSFIDGVMGDDLSSLCRGSVEITVPGYATAHGSNTVYDFPLLVSLSETSPEGFAFTQAASDGSDLRFTFDDPDNSIAYSNVNCRVDAWNVGGAAKVYVNMPRLNNNSKLKLRMYWGAYDAAKLPANDPSGVPTVCDEAKNADHITLWNTAKNEQETATGYIAFANLQYDATSGGEPVVKSDASSFSDFISSVTFTVGDMGLEALTDFPVLVRLKDGTPSGFAYSDIRQLPGGKDDIRFFDAAGNSLDYEVAQWDEDGESLFWVSLPDCRTGTKFQMAWGRRDGAPSLPAHGGAERVWRDYVGVWHMDETIDSAAATARTASKDSTGNGHDLVQRVGPEGVYYTQTSVPGVIGNARINDTSARNKKQGSYFEMNDTTDLKLDGVFTLSFWLKFDAYANYPFLASRRNAAKGNVGFQIDLNLSDRKQLVARGDTQTGGYNDIVDEEFKNLGFVHLTFVYDNTAVSIYADGVCKVDEMTIGKASDNGLPVVIGNKTDGTEQSVWGKYDEVRLYKGVKSASWIAAEHAQGAGAFYTSSEVVTDYDAVRQDWWKVAPSITKTEWQAGTAPTWSDIDRGTTGSGRKSVVEVFDRRTGNSIGDVLPSEIGDYRLVFTVAATKSWGKLTAEINFSISKDGGTHYLGEGNARVLLANDDFSVDGGSVGGQSYDEDWAESGGAYWRHLDESGADASTHDDIASTSPYYNFGGGVRHEYRAPDGEILWDLTDVRLGNTFNNYLWVYYQRGGVYEWDADGLQSDQNYLPWNPKSQFFAGWYGDEIEGLHAFAGQLVMRNTLDSAIVSSCLDDGIGTIYFDTVNSFTDNVLAEDGTSNYRLKVEITTNRTDGGSIKGLAAASYLEGTPERVLDILAYAEMKTLKMRVLHFAGGDCIEDFETDELSLNVTTGGTYDNFYRVIVPVNLNVPCRFRIIRTGIDPLHQASPDADSFILVDNVICSKPADLPTLEPYGRFDATRTGKQVIGWEGAFTPAYPSVDDKAIYGRAKATLADGTAPKAGQISAATMHYRWHYLEQATTDWLCADLNPQTMTSLKPLQMPAVQGDFDFWFDCHQSGGHYLYADYSGTGLGLGETGYSEAHNSVTNRAANYQSEGDWFVRTREGKSNYSAMVIRVKAEEDAAGDEIGMELMGEGLWRGFYRMTNAFENGIWWRIEPRDLQTDGATTFNLSTNWWYAADWTKEPPKFPAATRLMEGTPDTAWSRVSCDKETGYLMFQLDQSSLGATVIRADHQDFNTWDSAAGGYFVGSSNSETNGTSSSVQTADESYEDWPDTSADNEDWSAIFNGKLGVAPFDDLATFASASYQQWKLGKGRWVNEYYDDTNGRVAYKMAGCGEGSMEMSDRSHLLANWPNGLGSICFKARVAQDVSPLYAAMYSDNRLTNYTFMARGCFDMKSNQAFSGNASLSLFSYYRPGKGAYSVRWEQVKGLKEGNPTYSTTMTGPQKNGQRLVISRWLPSGEGTYTEEELSSVNNYETTYWKFEMPTMPLATGSYETNNLLPICISTYSDDKATYVVAGVRVTSSKSADRNGVEPDEEIRTYLPGDTTAPGVWYFVTYKDTSANRLKSGGYGVLSANCEGMLLNPQFRAQPSWPGNYKTKEEVVTGHLSQKFLATLSHSPGFVSCYDDDEFYWWNVDGYREQSFGLKASGYNGFVFVPPHQTVEVQTSGFSGNVSDGNWKTIDSIAIDNFGAPGEQSDYGHQYRVGEDVCFRVKTGGTLDDYRTDVVIADVVPNQWSGQDDWSSSDDDWDWTTDSKKSNSNNYYGSTNIVFTTGWVTNGAVRLSARRAKKDYACSVRSPLYDGGFIGGRDRGVGLGMISFKYRKPTRNIRLKVQVVTNYTSGASQLHRITRSTVEGTGDNSSWVTVTNLDYVALMENYSERDGYGSFKRSFGLYGVKGLMRVAIDNDLIDEVAAETDPEYFGEIDILEVACHDSPALDKGCWWGWNLQTIGDPLDSQYRMFLPDWSRTLSLNGMSLALNDSVVNGVGPNEDLEGIKEHMPFLQSPTFANALVGQVSFKARTFDLSDDAPPVEVSIYGAAARPDELPLDSQWKFITSFVVSNRFYETFTYKVNDRFYALRLGVAGVEGTLNQPSKPVSPQVGRVMIDEVTVSEPVSAMLSFRNVGAFRSGLTNNLEIAGVGTAAEQPLCNENWGIQAEVFPTMLGDEIDRETTPKVTLHWYVGKDPWGYERWKDCESGSAQLAQTASSNWVYRSSYVDAPDAVMIAQKSPETVQYMLEVVYRTVPTKDGGGAANWATNWLDASSWQVPEWYAPVDYNSDPDYGAGDTFAAFTILDTIAPGWAWINEMNILGNIDDNADNDEQDFQYIEVCVPAEADLTGWRIRLLDAIPGLYDDTVVTNWIAEFGTGGAYEASGYKKNNLGIASNKVFRCLGVMEGEHLKKSDGTFDGAWNFSYYDQSTFCRRNDRCYIGDYQMPIGVQLLRPSGIIEHSIVVIGTNSWGRLHGFSDFDPTNIVAFLNRNVPGSRFYYPGEDIHGTFHSDSVTTGRAETASVWATDWACSPGRINTNFTGQVQQLDPNHPTPNGDSVVIYAAIDTDFGHLVQHIGSASAPATTGTEIIVLKRESPTGTNIVYEVEPWYELSTVVTNDSPAWVWSEHTPAERRLVTVNVGKGATGAINVNATAQVADELSSKYHLTPDNPYTPAVMDWLQRGTTMRGAFADPGTIRLADVLTPRGDFFTNLCLTAMYWLDMDPTVGNLALKSHLITAWQDTPAEERSFTNVFVRVYMMITNRNDGTAWSPYTLRGLEPQSVSTDYYGDQSWTSVTYKVTGFLANGTGTGKLPTYNQFVPLCYCTFHDDSFCQDDVTDSHGPRLFTADIELDDPLSPASPGAEAGWYQWYREHGWTPVFYGTGLDGRLGNYKIEVLQPQTSAATSPGN